MIARELQDDARVLFDREGCIGPKLAFPEIVGVHADQADAVTVVPAQIRFDHVLGHEVRLFGAAPRGKEKGVRQRMEVGVRADHGDSDRR